jgi:hypothetical protein
MYPKHEKLFTDLSEKTLANSINWEASEVTLQYVLKLKNGAIMFDKTAKRGDWGQIDYDYSLKVLNKVGDAIDEFTIEGHPWYSMASQMFETIRRRVNRVDEQLDEIISEIDAADAS